MPAPSDPSAGESAPVEPSAAGYTSSTSIVRLPDAAMPAAGTASVGRLSSTSVTVRRPTGNGASAAGAEASAGPSESEDEPDEPDEPGDESESSPDEHPATTITPTSSAATHRRPANSLTMGQQFATLDVPAGGAVGETSGPCTTSTRPSRPSGRPSTARSPRT
jgi:hypothetical protein